MRCGIINNNNRSAWNSSTKIHSTPHSATSPTNKLINHPLPLSPLPRTCPSATQTWSPSQWAPISSWATPIPPPTCWCLPPSPLPNRLPYSSAFPWATTTTASRMRGRACSCQPPMKRSWKSRRSNKSCARRNKPMNRSRAWRPSNKNYRNTRKSRRNPTETRRKGLMKGTSSLWKKGSPSNWPPTAAAKKTQPCSSSTRFPCSCRRMWTITVCSPSSPSTNASPTPKCTTTCPTGCSIAKPTRSCSSRPRKTDTPT